MAELTVRLRCSIDPEARRSGSAVVVSRWIPLSEDDWFTVEAQGLEFRVWFDEDCVALLEDVSDLDIERQVNIWLDTICLDVMIPDVSDELAQFVYEERDRPQRSEDPPDTDKYTELRGQYQELGEQVHRGAIKVLNRVIDYFRVQKGQYWLDRHELDLENSYSFFVSTQANVQARDEWVRWCPLARARHHAVTRLERDRHLSEDEWPDLIDFVRGPLSTPPVLEFLSKADSLAADGYDRSAIVEAVSALERALHRFGRYPNRERLSEVTEHGAVHRIDLDSLREQIDHLGFKGSLRYLLPILLPAEVVPDETLERCREANTVRVNVVHYGKRSVDEDKLRGLLKSVREMCEALRNLTDPPTPP